MRDFRVYSLAELQPSLKGVIMNCEVRDSKDGLMLERRAATHDLLRSRIHGGLTDEELRALRGEDHKSGTEVSPEQESDHGIFHAPRRGSARK